jgi:hypothetical protein
MANQKRRRSLGASSETGFIFPEDGLHKAMAKLSPQEMTRFIGLLLASPRAKAKAQAAAECAAGVRKAAGRPGQAAPEELTDGASAADSIHHGDPRDLVQSFSSRDVRPLWYNPMNG